MPLEDWLVPSAKHVASAEPQGLSGLMKLLAGAALLAGTAAARKPLMASKLGPWLARKLPTELSIIGERAESPLISETERLGIGAGERIKRLVDLPMTKAYSAATPAAIKTAEQTAVDVARAAPGRIAARLAAGEATLPQFMQEAAVRRRAQLPLEQAARNYLGLSDIRLTSGPYVPRRVDLEASGIGTLQAPGGSLTGDLRTSVSGFQQARRYGTMLEGERAGFVYEDPRVSFLQREVFGMRLIETAKYIQRLDGKVLFRTEQAARAASPTGKAFELRGVPGAAKWWTPTREEQQFLIDNLTNAEHGALGFIRTLSNDLFRNPNLINPAPHFVKNMLYKYALSGGGPQVFRDMSEFWRGASPLVTTFKAAMPFDETGLRGEDVLRRAIQGIKGEGDALAPFKIVARTLGGANRWSSQQIFGRLDPALRYARWKQYVVEGLSPEAAANHTWVDLIRYGTRSRMVDLWKGIPLNFFVPWRTGTVTSLLKQASAHPLRTALIVGFIDYLREVRYRQTGRWTHLPIDYIEAPIANILMGRNPEDIAKGLIGATLGTMALGPGGGFAASQLAQALTFTGGGNLDLKKMGQAFWGLTQIVNVPAEAWRVKRAIAAGNPELVRSEVQNLLTALLLAEHNAMNYQPRRLLGFLGEDLPYMQKAQAVKQAEGIQRAGQTKLDFWKARRGRIPSIEQRLDPLRAIP